MNIITAIKLITKKIISVINKCQYKYIFFSNATKFRLIKPHRLGETWLEDAFLNICKT